MLTHAFKEQLPHKTVGTLLAETTVQFFRDSRDPRNDRAISKLVLKNIRSKQAGPMNTTLLGQIRRGYQFEGAYCAIRAAKLEVLHRRFKLVLVLCRLAAPRRVQGRRVQGLNQRHKSLILRSKRRQYCLYFPPKIRDNQTFSTFSKSRMG